LSDFSKTCLRNYQKILFNLTNSNNLADSELSIIYAARCDEIKITKLFRIIQDKTCDNPDNLIFDLKDKKAFNFEEIDVYRINSYMDQLLEDASSVHVSSADVSSAVEGYRHGTLPDDTPDNTSRHMMDRMFKLQSISLYLGMQPMARFLTSEEAYKLIFCDK